MRTIEDSTAEYARGLAGGFLLSLPLLYTMEVWWQGFILSPTHLLAFVGVTFVLLLGYNRFSGMRRDACFIEVVIDSVEELGLGIILSTLILFCLNKIWLGMPIEEALGKITIEAMTVAIGVSVGTAQLMSDDGDTGMEGDSDDNNSFDRRAFFEQIFVSFCGATLVGSSIAPTEEVLEIAVSSSTLHLISLMILSLCVIAAVLYMSNFKGADEIEGKKRLTNKLETVSVVYAISIGSAFVLLWMYGQMSGVSPAVVISEAVVLAFVTSLGASAGRLLIQ
jgi:putative integral membrane protein (TIGR02587 family)